MYQLRCHPQLHSNCHHQYHDKRRPSSRYLSGSLPKRGHYIDPPSMTKLCNIMSKINTTLSVELDHRLSSSAHSLRYSGQRYDIKALVKFLTIIRDELWVWPGQFHPSSSIDTLGSNNSFVSAMLQIQFVSSCPLIDNPVSPSNCMQSHATFIILYPPYLSSHFVRSTHPRDIPGGSNCTPRRHARMYSSSL